MYKNAQPTFSTEVFESINVTALKYGEMSPLIVDQKNTYPTVAIIFYDKSNPGLANLLGAPDSKYSVIFDGAFYPGPKAPACWPIEGGVVAKALVYGYWACETKAKIKEFVTNFAGQVTIELTIKYEKQLPEGTWQFPDREIKLIANGPYH